MGSGMKTVSCREAGADCDLVISDKDEAEIIALAQDHAKRKHGMEVTAEQVRGLMKEEACCCK